MTTSGLYAEPWRCRWPSVSPYPYPTTSFIKRESDIKGVFVNAGEPPFTVFNVTPLGVNESARAKLAHACMCQRATRSHRGASR